MDEQVGTGTMDESCGLYPTSLGLTELEVRRAELRLGIEQRVRLITTIHILELILQIVSQLSRGSYCGGQEAGGDGRQDLVG